MTLDSGANPKNSHYWYSKDTRYKPMGIVRIPSLVPRVRLTPKEWHHENTTNFNFNVCNFICK